MKCELCGAGLEQGVPLDHPRHIFNKPVRKHGKMTWLRVCRTCFNKCDNHVSCKVWTNVENCPSYQKFGGEKACQKCKERLI